MAVRDIKARVSIDGEKQYKQALNELNSGNKVLASEMKKLKAEYQGNTDSVEFLTKKGELLDRQLLQQKDKVETLRKAVAAAAEANGEADAKTQKWIVQLNNAEAQMYDLEHAVEENNQAMQGEGQTMVGLGDTVDGLASKLGIKLPAGAKDALNGMKGLSAGTVAAMGVAVAGVAALTKAVTELHQLTVEAAKSADEILTESMTTGLSTRTIQELKYAENLIDVSYGTITGSLTKLTKEMADAQGGNEALTESFRKLGVSVTDATTGQLRSAEDVFYEVIDALGQVENVTERDALAMEVLGKSAQELNPLIIQGSGALKDMAKEAEAAGYVLDESQIKKLGEVDDAYQRLQLQIEATKKELAVEFADASKTTMETFAKFVKEAGRALIDSGILDTLALIVENFFALFTEIGDVTEGLPLLGAAFQGLNTALSAVAITLAAIKDALNFVKSLVRFDFSGAANALGFGYGSGNANNVQRTMMRLDNRLDMYDSYYGRNASGNDNWRGGLTYLSESGAEAAILPQGTRILNAQDTAHAFGGDTFYVTIDAKSVREFNDIVEMAKSERVRRRMA